jgi:uncharacterized repeat protein (TIGR01451 family)
MRWKKMNKIKTRRKKGIIIGLIIVFSFIALVLPSCSISAESSFSDSLAESILSDPSILLSSSYSDTDSSGNRQADILSSMGVMNATNGDSFVLLSTGIAGAYPMTSNAENPGTERGEWFRGGQYPRDNWPYIYDRATLTMDVLVPEDMNYVYYDTQFFSTEYPDYVGSYYNDEFTVTVDSPSKGISTYVVDVNSGHFVLDAHSLSGTGFDLFATDGNPDGYDEVDQVDTTPRVDASDAGATALHTAGGHPVSPGERVTITFEIKDEWDNQFDSTAFIDNLMFAQYARPVIEASKTVEEIEVETDSCHNYLKYTLTISNIGVITQSDNHGDEIQDPLPEHTIYMPNSATATSGYVSFDSNNNIIKWNGEVPGDSSVVITFKVQVEDFESTDNLLISNQAGVYWDKNNDGKNEEYLSTNWANITVQPANLPPVVTDIPGETICGDEGFKQIYLDDYVDDPDDADEEISWELHNARTLWRNKITGRIEASEYLDWVEISDRIATISFPEDQSEWGKPEPAEDYEPVIEGASFVFKPQFNAIDPCGLISFTSSVGNFTFYESSSPIAKDDTDNCSEDSSVWTNVLENDFDVDENLDYSSLQVITSPTNGSTTVNKTTGFINYQPNENWYGIDSYEYRIDDNDGNTDTAIVTITVNEINDPPSASFFYDPSNPTTDDLINFTSTSTDDEEIVNWTWNMDDGTTLYGEQVTHQYTAIGSYNVNLTIEDERGANATAAVTIIVYPILNPDEYLEDFSDDIAPGPASEGDWFLTSSDGRGCNFEVSDASQFNYSNPNSFKTKMRADGEELYWTYKNLNSSIFAWEVWFYCGQSTEDTDLILNFKNDTNSIAKIRIKYDGASIDSPVGPSIDIIYINGEQSTELGSYLSNGFYRLQIIDGGNDTQYYLYSEEEGFNNMISIDGQSFSGLDKLEWSSSKNAVVCPMLFWDDHIIELNE